MALEMQAEAALPSKAVPRKTARNRRLILTVSRVWSWIFLGMLVAYFSVEGTGFFSIRNSQNILVAIVPILLMGLGQTFVIIAGGIDLSVGWVMGLSSVISAKVMANLILEDRPGVFSSIFDVTSSLGISTEALVIILGCVVGIIIGILVGTTNGLIVAKLRVPPFIVTLGVSFVARGVAWIISNANVVGGQPAGLRSFGNGALFYYVRGEDGGFYFFNRPELTGAQLRLMDRIITWPVFIMIILALIGVFLLKRTQFGRHTYAIGGNREAALRAGVHVDRHTIMLYVLSGLTCGVAGFLHTARYTGGSADAGDALTMMSIAAVVIGGVSLFGGAGRVTGTIVGALILAVLETGLVMTNVDPFWKYVVVGIIIITAVLIDQARDLIIGRAESAPAA
jgi:ribose transport system permease protein